MVTNDKRIVGDLIQFRGHCGSIFENVIILLLRQAAVLKWLIDLITLFRFVFILQILVVHSLAPICPAQESALTLNLDVPPDQQKASLIIPSDGIIKIYLIQKDFARKEDTLDLELSTFMNNAGHRLDIRMGMQQGEQAAYSTELRNMVINKPVLPIFLKVANVSEPGPYNGQLIMISKSTGHNIRNFELISGSNQRFPELIVDRNEVTLKVTKRFWKRSEPSFVISLCEKNNKWPLEGVSLSLNEINKAPAGGLSLKNIMVKNYEPEITELKSRSFTDTSITFQAAHQPRSIPVGGRLALEIRLTDLEIGEYDAKLQFQALNSAAGDRQSLRLKLYVRSSWLEVVIVIIIGACLTFFGNKFIVNLSKCSELQKQIADLNCDWLKTETQNLPMIKARALLRKINDLTRPGKFWLVSPDIIKDRIDELKELISILRKIRHYRLRCTTLSGQRLVNYRAEAFFNRVYSMLDDGIPDTQNLKTVYDRMDEMIKDNEKFYQEELTNAINRLFETDIKNKIDNRKDQSFYDSLNGQYEKVTNDFEILKKYRTKENAIPSQPADMNQPQNEKEMERLTLNHLIKMDREYIKLKILDEWLNEPEFGSIIEDMKRSDFEEFLENVDNKIWEKIEPTNLSLKYPKSSGPEPFGAYDPLEFSIVSDNPFVNKSYLFKHKLDYKWSFKIDVRYSLMARLFLKIKRKLAKEAAPSFELSPVSKQPRIFQFSPRKGKVTSSVEICYGQKGSIIINGASKGKKESKTRLSIASSKDFKWLKGFQLYELLSFLIVLGFAVPSGLYSLYFNNDVFGDFKDFIFVFLWGGGFDVGKNALQSLRESILR